MSNVNWESIEADYRAGILSIREVGSKHGVSDTAIRKKAKREEWSRDLEAKIQHKANELVRIKEVRTEVRTANQKQEKIIIKSNAEAVADVRLSQRGDIRKSKKLTLHLLEELTEQTINIDDLRNLGEVMRTEDKNGKDRLNDLYMDIIRTPERIKSMKLLSDTLKTLITLEREAWGIKDGQEQQSISDYSPPLNGRCFLFR